MQDPIYKAWRHVFKLDPERGLSDEALDAICLSGTDAILVGGSTGVTYDNTVDLLSRIRRYEVPCALEVSSEQSAVPGFDQYFIPLVLNTDRAEWIIGRQIEALSKWGRFVPWEETAAEGYIILNPEADAARLTGAKADLDDDQLEAYIYMADRLMKLPILYIEYSGVTGDMEKLQHASRLLAGAQLFYGGGIDSIEKAQLAARYAHTVVIGNALYDDRFGDALATVNAVRATIRNESL